MMIFVSKPFILISVNANVFTIKQLVTSSGLFKLAIKMVILISGLDPEMTSTQQSQFETTSSSKLPSQFDPSSTQQSDIFAETFFGDESQSQETELEKTSIGYETMSRTSSKKQPKKKKKRATIGF